jgi:hypothetical protein
VDQGPLRKELDRILGPHGFADGHDAIDTVNRLLRKNARVKETVGIFQLRRNQVEISEETWDVPKLVSLLHSSQLTTDEPTKLVGAVVVVHRGALEFLVDGRRRINHWRRNAVTDLHPVLVVSERAK